MRGDEIMRLTNDQVYARQKNLHLFARTSPQPGYEAALVGMLRSLAEYCLAYREAGSDEETEANAGEDGLFGEYLTDYVRTVKMLMNGERGRLDGNEFESELRLICENHKIDFPE